MADVLLIETGSGADMVLSDTDVTTAKGIENMPYMCMFGGDADWWGNELLFPNQPDLQFLSQTEKVLQSVVLNSDGRMKIEKAVLADLDVLKRVVPGINIAAQVRFIDNDMVSIYINMEGRELVYLWNPSTKSLTSKV